MRDMKSWLLVLIGMGSVALADDFAALVADRAAIERVYYDHRAADKPSFEQVLPRATLKRLVREDLRKEAALRKTYGVEVTPAMLQSEVQRINTTTRAPEMLAEIKAALGNDTNRFARAFAKPFIVGRLLRQRFDNDDGLHAAQRQQVEQTRNDLLAAKTNSADFAKLLALLKQRHFDAVIETTWQLGARPEEKPGAPSEDEMEVRQRFGPSAQILSPPPANGHERTFYLADLPGELQNVLRVQLRQAGDVSAVIEMPTGFLLHVAKERTAQMLSVAAIFVSKRSYEQWLAEEE
jgi:hypothetical protein